MRSVRDVLRLHFIAKQNPRAIARSLGCGRTTVQNYILRANKYNLCSWQEIEELSDLELEGRLGFKTPAANLTWQKDGKAMPDWVKVHGELKAHKKVTLALLWQEHLEENPQGYKYSQYCEHYRRWQRKLSVVMRQEHVAGEKTFVDYCDGIMLVDRQTGELRKTQLFVGCLGASSYAFAEATMTQTLPDWLSSHCRMYEFFGGVSEITVPDNLKSGVNKTCFYEPEINESYRDLSRHYNTVIIPAGVRKPKHKAKVEANVLVAQRWILACLRHKIFHSLEELNDAILLLLEKLNKRQMRHLKKSRLELFLELDKSALKALPPRRYEFAEWKKVKVNIDYHIEFDGHFYAVHYTHVHQTLMARATATVVELFLKGERLISHRRSNLKGKYTTPIGCMPKNHKAMVKWPPSRLISWGKSLGPSVGLLVEQILSTSKHPEQRYRSALGVLRLEKKYSKERLEKASQRALELSAISYKFVSDMLKNNMDKLIVNEVNNEQLSFADVEKANTRGARYYKQTRH